MERNTIEQMVLEKSKAAPRVSVQDVEAEILSEHYFTAADGIIGTNVRVRDGKYLHPRNEHDLLTFCVLVLANGFTVTGESACASPENFDPEIGRKIAREKAIDKVWPLLGFRLRDALAELGK